MNDAPVTHPEPERRIRLLVCDDQRLIRTCVCRVLTGLPQIEIVGEASGGELAVQLALDLQPDVVLMDISMPDLNGVEATRRILRQSPGIKIIAFSVESNRDMVHAAEMAGAHGYLLKTSNAWQILEAIGTVLAGERFVSVPENRTPHWPDSDT